MVEPVSTAVDANNAGFATPTGTDLISLGDDAITRNAQITLDLHNNAKKIQAVIPSGANLDTYRSEGDYLIESGGVAGTLTGYPDNAPKSTATVTVRTNAAGYGYQILTIAGTNPASFYRGQNMTSGLPWLPWRAYSPNLITLSGTADLDTLRTTNDYLIPNSTAAGTIKNYPAKATKTVARVRVVDNGSGYILQTLEVFGGNPQLFMRGIASLATTPYPFAPWVEVTNQTATVTADTSKSLTTDSVQNAALRNKVLVDELTRKYRVSTGGKGAVALRFDHGLANFRDKVLPLLDEFGFPAAQAINSRNWSYTENAGVTADIVNGWVQNNRLEIWNHSATHTNPASQAALVTEVKTSLEELRTQIPAATILGWMVPGVQATDPYLGMGTGTSPEQFSATLAGQLILANHAVSSGYTTGTEHRPLDGIVRNGEAHFTMDNQTVSAIKAEIDKAATRKDGLQLMLHPSVIDTSGAITAAQLREVLQYIKDKQTAGELAVLSPYQLAAATL